jgi:Domain of unknown function (DUF317)
MPQPSRDDPRRTYLVTPRYLAGPTDTGAPALQPLLDHGWHQHHDDANNIHLTAPDGRIRVAFLRDCYLLQSDDYTLWRITAYDTPLSTPRWAATFDGNTPVEIVAGLTETLAQRHHPDSDACLAQHGRNDDAFTPLAEAGWHPSTTSGAIEYTAPDTHATLTYLPHPQQDDAPVGLQQQWTAWGGPAGWASRWYAHFTTDTPTHLIAATATALADPTPVIRVARHIPWRCRDLIQTTPHNPLTLVHQRTEAARARGNSTDTQPSRSPNPATPRPPSAPTPPPQPRTR